MSANTGLPMSYRETTLSLIGGMKFLAAVLLTFLMPDCSPMFRFNLKVASTARFGVAPGAGKCSAALHPRRIDGAR